MMTISLVIGYVSAFLTTSAFIPQAVKVYKTKHTRDISLGMFSLMTAGLAGWLVYGIMIASMPMIAANVISLLVALYILVMKIKCDLVKDVKSL